jgi:hypothetical protein
MATRGPARMVGPRELGVQLEMVPGVERWVINNPPTLSAANIRLLLNHLHARETAGVTIV